MIMLLLSSFSHVRLCNSIDGSPPGSTIPGILQARTLEWVAISFSCMKVKSESEVAQSCPMLHDPMDCGLPGSSIHGIFQARVLEWVAIAFSRNMIILSVYYRPFQSGTILESFSVFHVLTVIKRTGLRVWRVGFELGPSREPSGARLRPSILGRKTIEMTVFFVVHCIRKHTMSTCPSMSDISADDLACGV